YHERWEFELAVDELATHQRHPGRPLRSKCPVGVISHYAVRALMREAAVRADLAPDRLSFVRAVRLIHDAIPEFQQTAPAGHPRLYARLLRDLAAVVLPARRPRSNPRLRK